MDLATMQRADAGAKAIDAQHLNVGMWAMTTDDRGVDLWGRITHVQVRRVSGGVTYTVAAADATFEHTALLRQTVHVLTAVQARRLGLS